MNKPWINKTLSLILTLALAFSVCAIFPAGALADGGEYKLTPASANITAGGSASFTVEQTDPTATPAQVPVKYVWNVSGGQVTSGGGETNASLTAQFANSGSYSVSCQLFSSTEPTAQPFDTVSATVGVSQAPAPAAPQAAAPQETTPAGSEGTGSDPVPAASGSNSGIALLSVPDYDVNITTTHGGEFTSMELSTGFPLGLSVTDGNSNSALGDVTSATWSSSNTSIVTVSGNKSGATLKLGTIGMGSGVTITVNCKIKDSSGVTHDKSASFDITEVKPSISFTTANGEMEVNGTKTITVTKYPANANIIFESSAPATVSVSPTAATTANKATLTAKALSASATTITAYFQNYPRADVYANYDVTAVTGKAPTLNWKQSSVSVVAGSSINLRNYLNYTSGLTLTFDDGGSSVGTLNTDTGMLTTSAGAEGVATISVESAATAVYKAAGPVSIQVYVGTNYPISVGNSTMKLGVNSSGITAITKGNDGEWQITSSNTNVAVATPSDSSARATVLNINGYQTGTATITVRAVGSTSSATIVVTVGTPTAAISANFFNTDGRQTLSPYYNYGTLQVSVANYNPAQPYVTVSRNNIRTYVRNGSYTSHASTNNYTAALYPSASDPTTGVATLYIVPQYNGTTHYTASYTYASGTAAVTAQSQTITVSGFATLPQTGADYTWAYVLGGLCLATVATAVTLNVKRKKKQQQD